MKIFANAVFGTASEIDPKKIEEEFEPILFDEEEITGAFRLVRDLIVFTRCRMIFVDKQGVTGSKREYHSIPYKSISQFSVETAGRFDMDGELKIWISSNQTSIVKEFKKGTDIISIQKMMAKNIFS